jgi:hypothetical protein
VCGAASLVLPPLLVPVAQMAAVGWVAALAVALLGAATLSGTGHAYLEQTLNRHRTGGSDGGGCGTSGDGGGGGCGSSGDGGGGGCGSSGDSGGGGCGGCGGD